MTIIDQQLLVSNIV